MKSMGTRSKVYILKYMIWMFKIWIKYPGLRFCQLIQNVLGIEDIYYIEDKELKRLIKKRYEEELE